MPVKIVDLTAEEAPSNDDLIVIRDNASGTTRKITLTSLFSNPPLGNNIITHAMLGEGIIEAENLAESARPSVRVQLISSSSSVTHNYSTYDVTSVSSLAVGMAINAPGGTPQDGQGFLFRFKDNGVARSLSWASAFVAIGVTLPVTTIAGKWMYVAGRYNGVSGKSDVLAIGREA